MPTSRLPINIVRNAVAIALTEDLGLIGDVTTTAVIAPEWNAVAAIVSREDGFVAGLPVAEETFRQLDPDIAISTSAEDGDRVRCGQTVMRISGNARAILTAERTALNFVGRMSGIASLTARYVEAVAGTTATIVETRKTTPGLRALEKYAVRCGGGMNHRFGLFDAVLIKDNHIAIAGGIGAAIQAARNHAGHMVKIEVEVDTLDQLDEALGHRIDAVLLDNMDPEQLRAAVAKCAGRVVTEASGGIDLDTVGAIAETGVDLISVGALTHSAPVLDVGLDSEVRPH